MPEQTAINQAAQQPRSGSKIFFKTKRFARYLGLYRRTITTQDGVRYKERTGTSLRRAIQPDGSGVKEYNVRFPTIDAEGRRGMRIRYTPTRLYAEVGHDPRTVLYAQLANVITPGLRILEIGCGTGSGTSILSNSVGPSGGVIAIDRDGESIRFARHRHQSTHCGFELGWLETLDGEIEGAFDTVIAVDPIRGLTNSPERIRAISELTRVLRPSGRIIIILSEPSGLSEIQGWLESDGIKFHQSLILCPKTAWTGTIFTKPGDPAPRGSQAHHAPSPFKE